MCLHSNLNGKRDTTWLCYWKKGKNLCFKAYTHTANGASECVVCVFWGFNNTLDPFIVLSNCSVFCFALVWLRFDFVFPYYFIFFHLLCSSVICYCLLIFSAHTGLEFFFYSKQRQSASDHTLKTRSKHIVCIVAHTQLDIPSYDARHIHEQIKRHSIKIMFIFCLTS